MNQAHVDNTINELRTTGMLLVASCLFSLVFFISAVLWMLGVLFGLIGVGLLIYLIVTLIELYVMQKRYISNIEQEKMSMGMRKKDYVDLYDKELGLRCDLEEKNDSLQQKYDTLRDTVKEMSEALADVSQEIDEQDC